MPALSRPMPASLSSTPTTPPASAMCAAIAPPCEAAMATAPRASGPNLVTESRTRMSGRDMVRWSAFRLCLVVALALAAVGHGVVDQVPDEAAGGHALLLGDVR